MLKNLGERIRKLRKEKGMTLVEISEKTGIAQATLSRIETGTMLGTVESHEKIAEALGTGLGQLYAEIDRRYDEIAHQTKDAPKKVTQQGKDVRVELLTAQSSSKKITPLLMTLQGDSKTGLEHLERGVEKFLYVLDGEITVKINQQDYVLKAGDTLYFDASLPHQILNARASQARVLVAVSPSKI
ncbi:MAG: XRE family transcriptional regulator [Candidatus Omnitrophota bacterium]